MTPRTPFQRLIKTWISYPLQAALIYALFYFFKALPLDTASALGARLGSLIGPLIGANGKIRRNIALALPELDSEQQNSLIAAMWQNLGRIAGEYAHLDKFDDSRVEIIGGEHLETVKAAHQPAMFIAAHLANWEIVPVVAAKRGLEASLIYRHANNPYVDQLLRRAREPMGKRLARKGVQGARSVHGALRTGQIVGMLVDQKYTRGRSIPFFGRPALTAPAFAELALQYQAPILMIHTERLNGAHFRITVHPPLSIPQGLSHQDTVDAILTHVNAEMERWIRMNPSQWLWLHRRW